MSSRRLNTAELHQRIDERRQDRGISWRQVARECTVSPNVLSRLGRGGAPDANALLTLLLWVDPDSPLGAFTIPTDGPADA